jgi:hypothetical protein
MEEEINIKIKKSASTIYLGKIVMLLLFSILCGWTMSESEKEDYKTGQNLTKEQYLANYDSYKTELTSDEPISPLVGTIVFIFLSIVFFGIYELLGVVFGKMVEMFLNRERDF